MNKKHLDINGKNIRINDVVVIHKAEEYFLKNRTEKFYGNIGVVVDFGCVTVETYDRSNRRIETLYFGCDEVEVIGRL